MNYLIIYIIGYIFCYITFKLLVRSKDENSWKDIKFTTCYSFLSWIGFIIILVLYIVEHFSEQEEI